MLTLCSIRSISRQCVHAKGFEKDISDVLRWLCDEDILSLGMWLWRCYTILQSMILGGLFKNVLVRNVLGLGALLLLHFLVDFVSMQSRDGYSKITPYIFVALMYGWIVFHNRVLFEKFFLHHRKPSYFAWTGLAMAVFSFNMYYIISTSFKIANPLPQIISFWIYTFAGLGVYVLWKTYVNQNPIVATQPGSQQKSPELQKTFAYIHNGQTHEMPVDSIYYLESLENYVRIFTSARKPIVIRMTLKEAEANLQCPPFLRISRSHIVNMNLVQRDGTDSIRIGNETIKIGKVYKKYVEAYWK